MKGLLTVVNDDEQELATDLIDSVRFFFYAGNGKWVATQKELNMSTWGYIDTSKYAGQSKRGDPRAKEYMIRCPFCKAEFRVWLLPGDVFVDCTAYSCGKTIVIEELLRPEYRAKNGEVK
jgi:hypothetical protein